METETAPNPYELAARTKKAARIAVCAVQYGHDETSDDNTFRAIAAGIGVNYPSDDTLAVVRELISGR